MPSNETQGGLTNRISQLLQEREQHERAIAEIDETLSRVVAALGGGGAGGARRGRKPGRPPGRPAVAAAVRAAASAAGNGAGPGRGRGRRRRRGSFATSGEESVLGFIRENKNPSTQDVNRHWKGEGRGGSADNTLSKLVREKRLKRMPIEGQRGSTYAVA